MTLRITLALVALTCAAAATGCLDLASDLDDETVEDALTVPPGTTAYGPAYWTSAVRSPQNPYALWYLKPASTSAGSNVGTALKLVGTAQTQQAYNLYLGAGPSFLIAYDHRNNAGVVETACLTAVPQSILGGWSGWSVRTAACNAGDHHQVFHKGPSVDRGIEGIFNAIYWNGSAALGEPTNFCINIPYGSTDPSWDLQLYPCSSAVNEQFRYGA